MNESSRVSVEGAAAEVATTAAPIERPELARQQKEPELWARMAAHEGEADGEGSPCDALLGWVHRQVQGQGGTLREDLSGAHVLA